MILTTTCLNTPGTAFKFTDENQIPFQRPNGNGGLVKTYEDRIDDWATKYGLAAIPESKECLVLLSLAYNGGVLGGKLALAVNANNRAEAWYEIRYGSNGDEFRHITGDCWFNCCGAMAGGVITGVNLNLVTSPFFLLSRVVWVTLFCRPFHGKLMFD